MSDSLDTTSSPSNANATNITDKDVSSNGMGEEDASKKRNAPEDEPDAVDDKLDANKTVEEDTAMDIDEASANDMSPNSNSPPKKKAKLDVQKKDTKSSSFNTIESLLAVPTNYILRKTSSQNKNPRLLSSMEAKLLLQITTLSYEIDALIQMSIEAIENSHQCKRFSQDIHESQNVFLRPLLCLLHTHGRVIPQQIVQHVQNHLEEILTHFPIVIQSLKQCAEQNWSVSNALDGMEIGMLGKEKGLLAELEEEVCNRMEKLMNICNDGNFISQEAFNEKSMKDFCTQLFDGNNNTESSSDALTRNESDYDAASALGMLAAVGTSTLNK
ncbi:hypothetical protein CTEN210_01497 [Chaetoceros tenuissimus]|uniref:Uncharacterized protein n=1 Tax=Chaetoceros tenuissimus TaxID=426638 RepID=A0AAD3CFR1_9STRA|nr:hypothetical protein CTEN210_01497 [Chaetoceros tenuissimus]